jgi:secretion/DNA translocation related TadE-like protein
MNRFHKNENGSATILSISIVSFLAFFTIFLITFGNIVNLKIKTQKSADLVALSASQRLIYSMDKPCEFASKIAELNGVNMDSCTNISGEKVKVSVSKKNTFGYSIHSTATADK